MYRLQTIIEHETRLLQVIARQILMFQWTVQKRYLSLQWHFHVRRQCTTYIETSVWKTVLNIKRDVGNTAPLKIRSSQTTNLKLHELTVDYRPKINNLLPKALKAVVSKLVVTWLTAETQNSVDRQPDDVSHSMLGWSKPTWLTTQFSSTTRRPAFWRKLSANYPSLYFDVSWDWNRQQKDLKTAKYVNSLYCTYQTFSYMQVRYRCWYTIQDLWSRSNSDLSYCQLIGCHKRMILPHPCIMSNFSLWMKLVNIVNFPGT